MLERFKVLGGQNGGRNRFFGGFFSMFFLERSLTSILGGVLEARNLKNYEKPLFFQWSLQIFVASTLRKKWPKIVDFGFIFGSRNDEFSIIIVFENMCFLLSNFQHFFRMLAIWARFREAPGVPKIAKKKSCSGRVWNAFETQSDFGSDFGEIFGRFGEFFSFFGG